MKGNQIITPDNIRAFERSLEMLDTSIQQLSKVTNNLVPQTIIDSGLPEALKEFCNHLSHEGSIQVDWKVQGVDYLKMNETVDIHLYRIVRELVFDLLQQARGSQLLIQLSYHPNFLQVIVSYDGDGSEHDTPSGEKRVSWETIRSGIQSLQGTIDFQHEAGKGTFITITIPR